MLARFFEGAARGDEVVRTALEALQPEALAIIERPDT